MPRLLLFLPCRWSRYVPFDLLGVRNYEHSYRLSEESLRPLVEQHRKTLDPENPRDYVDAFLIEMNSRPDNAKDSFFSGVPSAFSLA